MIASKEKPPPGGDRSEGNWVAGSRGNGSRYQPDCKPRIDKEALKPRLAEYLGKIGVELRPQGARLVGRCPHPAHNDHSPSFSVFDDGRACGCYPCSFTGDIFAVAQWLGRAGGFREAAADVCAVLGATLPEVSVPLASAANRARNRHRQA